MLLGQHEPAREDFAAVRALAQEVGDPRWEAVALDRLGHSYRRQDRISRALEHFESALALSRKAGDPSLTGRILNHIGFVYFNVAKFEEALRPHEEARHSSGARNPRRSAIRSGTARWPERTGT